MDCTDPLQGWCEPGTSWLPPLAVTPAFLALHTLPLYVRLSSTETNGVLHIPSDLATRWHARPRGEHGGTGCSLLLEGELSLANGGKRQACPLLLPGCLRRLAKYTVEVEEERWVLVRGICGERNSIGNQKGALPFVLRFAFRLA